MSRNLLFDEIQEVRDEYFVSYRPSYDGNFANLSISFLKKISENKMMEIMEKELSYWIKKYPIPIMAASFDDSDMLIYIQINDSNHSHLYGWIAPETKELKTTWDDNQAKIIDTVECKDGWDIVMKNIGFRTQAQIKVQADIWAKQKRKEIISIKIILFLWFCVIPLTWVILQFLGPVWIGVAVTIYSIWEIIKKTKKMLWVKNNVKETSEQEKQRKMKHYYYHCELNPEGFNRLRTENFKKETQGQVAKEYAELKNKANLK